MARYRIVEKENGKFVCEGNVGWPMPWQEISHTSHYTLDEAEKYLKRWKTKLAHFR